jgi:hypothetical protein
MDMNLSNLCPIPLAWVPYFLDFKTPHKALQMGRLLLATLETVAQRTRASLVLDWLCAACMQLGPNAVDRNRSVVHQGFEATAPDSWVVTWMQAKLAPYKKASPMSIQTALGAGVAGGVHLLPAGGLATHVAKKEYSALETSKIQAACGLTDAQWDTDLPELYPRMLEEGRTTARVKALLEDVFRVCFFSLVASAAWTGGMLVSVVSCIQISRVSP